MTAHHGQCLCGSVRWRYDGEFHALTHCHCSLCRKAHGTGFATYAMGARASFTWEAGEEFRVQRESSPGFVRAFCARCGSVVPNTSLGEWVAAPAGGFIDELGLTPTAHIFVASRAPWVFLDDDLPRHDYYPGQTTAPVPSPALSPGVADTVRGACLCGEVAFEVTAPFSVVHHCHCSRCRRGRAAAHATNGIVPLGGVRFTRGSALLRTYRPEDARFFTQVFCASCGGKLPRECAERKITVVPFGALDDAPGRLPDDHIFTGSAASWFEIRDGLPRYEAGVPAPVQPAGAR